jgi:CheY-like chemotaxis protein
MRVCVATENTALREGLHMQITACGGVAVDNPGDADAILADAGTGNVPELTMRPEAGVPVLVMLTPNARGNLPQMRAMGFSSYLVKPVRQSSLAIQLIQCRDGLAPAASEVSAAGLRPSQGVRDAHRRLHILLAEDNPINMMLIRELLRRRGHTVTEVTTGNDAVQAMLACRYDLLLTDIHMPGMDGIEAARVIRAGEVRGGLPRTPIVALTADVLESGRDACLDAGMDGFLAKPVDPALLEEMLAALFPSAEASHIVAA